MAGSHALFAEASQTILPILPDLLLEIALTARWQTNRTGPDNRGTGDLSHRGDRFIRR